MNINEVLSAFENKYGKKEGTRVYSAPGRVELGGNHTDHQGGCVLAAAINLTSIAAVCENGENIIRVTSDGYGEVSVSLSELCVIEEEKNSTVALVRGVAKGLSDRGVILSGVDMYVASDVLRGSGLSSSASFEVLVATALSDMFGGGLSAPELAEVGQFAEREFFGKPCGLMDQTACSVGGIVAIDFKSSPAKIKKVECNLDSYGYDLVIIDAGADHADLTQEYADITIEMGKVSEFFGKRLLSEVSEEEFYDKIKDIRKLLGDRAVLRAIHYFGDCRRAVLEAECLERGDFDGFLKLINESGNSSFKYLQNIYVSGAKRDQAMAFALALCEKFLEGRGAARIQGGGFGGTLEAFVPKDITEKFVAELEKALGENMCRILSFSNVGGARIK